jgi:hypothetical protein
MARPRLIKPTGWLGVGVLVHSSVLAATCARRVAAVERTFWEPGDGSVDAGGRARAGVVFENVFEEVNGGVKITRRRRHELGG